MEERPLWEMLGPLKLFYTSCIEPVCKKYDVSRTELDILLFLAENPSKDTAAEIVQKKYLAKSHVSTSVKLLTQRGYLQQIRDEKDRRVTRLCVTELAQEIIRDGQLAQKGCQSKLLEGISHSELKNLYRCFETMQKNVQDYTDHSYWKNE